MTEICDGTGDGYSAKVNSDNQLFTFSTTETEVTTISRQNEDAYIFATGAITEITTTATETGFFYFKNTSETKKLYIHSIRTCGEQIQKWRLYKNATAGTLITNAVAGNNNNMNISGSKTASADVYKGVDGDTVSGGTMMEHWINDVGHSEEFFDGSLILSKNDSLALSLETDTAGDFCARAIVYYR